MYKKNYTVIEQFCKNHIFTRWIFNLKNHYIKSQSIHFKRNKVYYLLTNNYY